MSKTIYAVIGPHGRGRFFLRARIVGRFQCTTEQPLDMWSREQIKQHTSDWAVGHLDKDMRDFDHLAVFEIIEGGMYGKKADADRGPGGDPSTTVPA